MLSKDFEHTSSEGNGPKKDIHVTLPGHIILTPSRSVFAITPKAACLAGKVCYI